jgi:hypothetical protein
MQTRTVGQKSRNSVIFAVYEGKTHRRPTSEGNDWLGFESLWAQYFGRDSNRLLRARVPVARVEVGEPKSLGEAEASPK